MDSSLQQTVATLLEHGQWWALPLLAGAAAIEYIFPPFPGDTVTLAGAVLARLGDWNIALIFAALMTGNLVGAMADYLVGRKLLNPERLAARRGIANHTDALERVLTGIRRYGPALLVINRFVPGIRALFFVAAGMARLRPAAVFFYAALSAALWTALLIAAGILVGDNLPLLEHLFSRYFQIAWVLVVAIVGVLIWRRLRR